MIKANPTIYKFYLTVMDLFSEQLPKTCSEDSAYNIDYYKTIVIKRIVRMWHTLESLVINSRDEVSARCVLRGILDSVATYCYIYERNDNNEILFRHFLYLLDGYRTYKRSIVDGILEIGDDYPKVERECDEKITTIENTLYSHPYCYLNNDTIKKIIQQANWKYASINNPKSLGYKDIYLQMGLDENTANYYQGFLSQYAHGLCFSNFINPNSDYLFRILYESIPLLDIMIKAILKTFPKNRNELLLNILRSDRMKDFINNDSFITELLENLKDNIRNVSI